MIGAGGVLQKGAVGLRRRDIKNTVRMFRTVSRRVCELRLHPSAERPACRSDGAKIRKFPPPQILDQIMDYSTCIRYFYRIYRSSGVRIGQQTERPIE